VTLRHVRVQTLEATSCHVTTCEGYITWQY